MGTCWITLLFVIGMIIYMSVKSSIMNKQGKEQEDKLPNESKLLLMNPASSEKQKEMYNLGAKMIFSDSVRGALTILTNNTLCFRCSGNRFFVTPPSLNAEIKFDVEKNTATYTTTKNKSAVGRAVVGGALAGGVGAVVGAASAVSGDGKKTVSRTYKTGDYHLKIKLSDISSMEPTILYVSNDLINKIGPLVLGVESEKNNSYTEYDIGRINMVQKNTIVEYLQKAINTR